MASVVTGDGTRIDDGATVGYDYCDDPGPTVLGDDSVVRHGSIVYGDVEAGDEFVTGHGVLVREDSTFGDDVVVGTDTVVDGRVTVGSHVSVQTGVYVPPETTVGDNVFLGPRAVLTNDAYPVRGTTELEGPTIEDGVSVGANATILPGVTVGEGSFVAAGAVVDRNVPPDTLAMGVPVEFGPLPEPLQEGNAIA
ncbi:acyltransferase [Halostella salina]|uniref:acyltransferase n=1 Tax=Halostella salina TaxID=1547897 RepID=UPI000EF7F48D|nr:acyltransferase [Halostella salina]